MSRLNEVLNYKSKWTYPNGVLKNNLAITDAAKLDQADRRLSSVKLGQLYLHPYNGKFDIKHYLSIHKYLFEEIYPFAGEIRDENIKKTFPFCVPAFIYPNLT